jgi:hypothetical protein
MPTSEITLGTDTLEITRDVTSNYSPEIIAKRNVVSVATEKFQSKANYTEKEPWKYRFDTITIVTLWLRDKTKLSFELQEITNQPTWSTGTLAGLNQAVIDLGTWMGSFVPPPPPFLIASDNSSQINTISGLTYEEGSGPSSPSSAFRISAANLIPTSGTITVTPSANIEFTNDGGTTWYSTPQNFSYNPPGSISTGLLYKVRLKAGLSHNTYSELLTISGQAGINVPDFVISISASVTIAYIVATGGDTEITDGDYKVLVFNNSGNIVITKAPVGKTADILLVAGGGAGGNSIISAGGAGGGGGGGVISTTISPSVGTFSVVIGSGGAASGSITQSGGNGSNSTALSQTAIGGGGGAGANIAGSGTGSSGGSGGGGGYYLGSGGSGTAGQGKSGATAPGIGGGGGGGSSAAGSGLNGGNGISSSITGTPTNYAGGGGGGINVAPIGTGGLGGGGNGAELDMLILATAGAANTGGGGGGGYGTTPSSFGANGASGAFYFRFKFQN